MTERRKYQRTIPSGKKKLLVVPTHDRRLSDVIDALRAFEGRNGDPYTYVSPDGEIVVAVNNWTA